MNEFDSRSSKQRADDPFAQSFKQGDFAAAFLNKKWSRCLVLDIESNQRAHVECVDYCTRHYVHLSKLEKLGNIFRKLPRYAFRCELSDWTSEELCRLEGNRFRAFKKWLEETKPNALVEIQEFKECNYSMIYEVKLLLNNVEFKEQFKKF